MGEEQYKGQRVCCNFKPSDWLAERRNLEKVKDRDKACRRRGAKALQPTFLKFWTSVESNETTTEAKRGDIRTD